MPPKGSEVADGLAVASVAKALVRLFVTAMTLSFSRASATSWPGVAAMTASRFANSDDAFICSACRVALSCAAAAAALASSAAAVAAAAALLNTVSERDAGEGA